MSWTEPFVPRDAAAARRLVLILMAVGIVTTAVVTFLVPSVGGGASTAAIVPPAIAFAVAVAVSTLPSSPSWMWFCYPISGVVALVAANLISHDASVTAQVFGFFPVLYAGAQLRRPAATVVCGLTIGAELATTFAQLKPGQALADTAFLAAAMITMTAVLVHSADRVEELVSRLREQAAVDPLTGLVTRRVLDSAVSTSLESAARDGGTAMIVIDIDHFKQINDRYGHLVGDAVLRHVATTLRTHCRQVDVVSRMGGDELAILMPGCSLSDAMNRADDLLGRVRNLSIDVDNMQLETDSVLQEPRTVGVTVSMGLAHLPTHANAVHELYRAADAALYAAKRGGRDRVRVESARSAEAAEAA